MKTIFIANDQMAFETRDDAEQYIKLTSYILPESIDTRVKEIPLYPNTNKPVRGYAALGANDEA